MLLLFGYRLLTEDAGGALGLGRGPDNEATFLGQMGLQLLLLWGFLEGLGGA